MLATLATVRLAGQRFAFHPHVARDRFVPLAPRLVHGAVGGEWMAQRGAEALGLRRKTALVAETRIRLAIHDERHDAIVPAEFLEDAHLFVRVKRAGAPRRADDDEVARQLERHANRGREIGVERQLLLILKDGIEPLRHWFASRRVARLELGGDAVVLQRVVQPFGPADTAVPAVVGPGGIVPMTVVQERPGFRFAPRRAAWWGRTAPYPRRFSI